MSQRILRGLACVLALSLGVPAGASQLVKTLPSETPEQFKPNVDSFDYTRREVMIPMRDGVKLKTFILVPKRATKDAKAPIIMTRTPYNAGGRIMRFNSPRLLAAVPQMNDTTVEAGYIVVYQDVRGKFGSDGDYVMTRPLSGPVNPTRVDHATDAYDTIDWLVKNVPEATASDATHLARTGQDESDRLAGCGNALVLDECGAIKPSRA